MDTATTPTKAVIKEGFFLRRPVFSAVLSIFFVIMGLMALRVLPVSQYPDLVPPTVMVMAQYPGASPETIAQTVATPLEQQINGVDDMIYMNSVSSVSGVMLLTVYFEVGTDPDMATVNVNNRVQAALAGLPEIVRQYGVTVMKRSSAILEMVTLSAADDMYDTVYLNNYATINIVDGLKRIPGVGNAEVLGSKDWAMRIWLNPLRMAELNLSTADIAQAVRDQNNQYSAGTIGAQPGGTDIMMTWQVSGLGRLLTAEEFGNIIIRTQPGGGGVLRLKDVARVELGAANYDLDAKVNGVNAVPMAIYLASGANALDTADRVAEYMQTISQNFPVGLQYEVPYDTTTFVRISIEEVIQTLIEAIVLVFLVVFLFLQKWRATLIPCLAVPIALIGTFAGIYALGFSINTLTLFALVLAIGIVVDDAIVVMENMTRVLETEDLTPRQATAKAMSEVTAPVIAIVLVLCAVFIPVGFLGGLAGVMYRQFAITIAISVIISGIVALTLTPALCVLLIRKSTHEPRGFFKWFNAFFAKVTDGFTAGVKVFLRSSLLTLSLMAALLAATWGLFERVPTALVPEEDQGALMVMAILPDGTALPQTQALMNRVADQVEKLKGVKYTISLAGFDMMNGTLNPNNGAIFLTLDDWSERDAQGITVEDILKEVYVIGMAETKGLVLPFNPPPIVGLSNTGGFEMMIESTSGNDKELSDVTRAFLAGIDRRQQFLQRQRAAPVRRSRPRKGPSAQRQRQRRVQYPGRHPGGHLYQRLQQGRPHVPRVHAGRRRLSQPAGRHQKRLRAQHGRQANPHGVAGIRTGRQRAANRHSLQRPHGRQGDGQPRLGLQLRSGHRRPSGCGPASIAPRLYHRLVGFQLPGSADRRHGLRRTGPVAAHGLPHPGRPVRTLEPAPGRSFGRALRRVRGHPRQLADGPQQRRLYPGGHDHSARPGL